MPKSRIESRTLCGEAGVVHNQRLRGLQVTNRIEHVVFADGEYVDVAFPELNNVKFLRCTFRDCTFPRPLTQCEFEGCAWTGTTFDADWYRLKMSKCTLTDVQMSAMRMTTVHWDACRLTRLKMHRVESEALTITKCTGRTLELRWFNGTEGQIDHSGFECFRSLESTWSGFTFTDTKFPNSNWESSQWRAVTSRNCSFKGAKFRLGKWIHCTFHRSLLNESDITQAVVHHTTVCDSQFVRSSWHRSRLEHVTFLRCAMRDADWTGAHLRSCTFRYVDDTGSVMRDTTLHNVNRTASEMLQCRARFETPESTDVEYTCRFVPYDREGRIPLKTNSLVTLESTHLAPEFRMAADLASRVEYLLAKTSDSSLWSWVPYSMPPTPRCVEIRVGSTLFLPKQRWVEGVRCRVLQRVPAVRTRTHSY